MRRIRVLQVLSKFDCGGAERMAMHLITNIDHEKFDTAAVSLYNRRHTDMEEKLDLAGVQVWYLGKFPGPDLRMIPRLRVVINRFKPNIIHTHGGVLRYVMPAVWRQGPTKIVHTVHNLAEKEVGKAGQVLHWFAFRNGTATPVAIAKRVRASITNVYGIQNVPLIPNGIPTSEYENGNRSAIRDELGLHDSETMFLAVGRLEPQKNYRLLLRSFAEARSRLGSSLQLCIAGSGSQEDALKNEAVRLGIASRVRFLGNRQDVPDLLAAADTFVLSSDWEGNPLAVMEAMAAGKAVIATSVGGVPELVNNEDTGLLVGAGAETGFADAMIRVALSSDVRDKLGKQGKQMAEQCFGVRAMARAYEELYLRKLSVPNHAAASALR